MFSEVKLLIFQKEIQCVSSQDRVHIYIIQALTKIPF